MAEQKTLKKALRQMSEGSKSGFHTFYLGSIQYIYSSARLLYDTHEDACRFVVDVYQYLYLHLPEYDMSHDLQGWISKMIRERYLQLSIGKQRNPSPLGHPIATSTLTKAEQDRIWHILDLHIHFPNESKPLSPSRILLIISAVLLLLLLASRYVPTLAEKLSDITSLSDDAQETDTAGDESEGSTENDTEDSESGSDMDEINDLINQVNADKESDSATDDEDLSGMTSQQITQDSGTQDSSTTEPTVTEPTVTEPTVDTPTVEEPTVDTPTAPSASSSADSSSSSSGSQSSGTQDLENLELELYYGDSLKYADDN